MPTTSTATRGSNNALLVALADALAGALGSVVAVLAFYPIDIAKTRAQARQRTTCFPADSAATPRHTALDRGIQEGAAGGAAQGTMVETPGKRKGGLFRSHTLATLLSIVRKEGLARLYEGIEAKALQSLMGSFVYFYAYAFIKGVMRRRAGGTLRPSLNLLAAALAGAVNQAFTLPLENITTRMQTAPPEADSANLAPGPATSGSGRRTRGGTSDCGVSVGIGIGVGVGVGAIGRGGASADSNGNMMGSHKKNKAEEKELKNGGTVVGGRYQGGEHLGEHLNNSSSGSGISSCSGAREEDPRTEDAGVRLSAVGTVGESAEFIPRQQEHSSLGEEAVVANDLGIAGGPGLPRAVAPPAAESSHAHVADGTFAAVMQDKQRTKRPRPRQSLLAVAGDLYREGKGASRFWRGFAPSLILTCNPAINFTSFDLLKALWLKRRATATTGAVVAAVTAVGGVGGEGKESGFLNPVEAFVVGAAAKSVATLITYPLIRAKVILMTASTSSCSSSTSARFSIANYSGEGRGVANMIDPHGMIANAQMLDEAVGLLEERGAETTGNHNSATDAEGNERTMGEAGGISGMMRVLVGIVRHEGLAGLYAGCGAQLLHTILKSALFLATKEEIARAAASAVFLGGSVRSRQLLSAASDGGQVGGGNRGGVDGGAINFPATVPSQSSAL